MPTLGKAEGVFNVIALSLDLCKVYNLVKRRGPKFVFTEVTPFVSGVVEHYDRAILLCHYRVIVLKKSGSCGEGRVVEGVEMSVIGCDVVGLLNSVKSNEVAGIVVAVGVTFFLGVSWRFNALLGGEAAAGSMGVRVELLRFLSLLLSSVITAVCVSLLGIIGFVGIICPHVTKKLLGQDHRFSIPMSVLLGSILLLVADTLSRTVGSGAALPVGAITSLLGAPFFIAIIVSGKEGR